MSKKDECEVYGCHEIAVWFNPRSGMKYCDQHYLRIGKQIRYSVGDLGEMQSLMKIGPKKRRRTSKT